MFQDMDDTDIRDLFSPFGEIRQLHLTKDEVSNENKGNAFIEYSYGWNEQTQGDLCVLTIYCNLLDYVAFSAL